MPSNAQPQAFRFAAFTAILALMAACTCPPRSTPPDLMLDHTRLPLLAEGELKKVKISAERAAQLDAFPVVDLHTHTFNALYLPLQNIALSRTHQIRWGALADLPTTILVAGIVGTAILNDRDPDRPEAKIFIANAKTAGELGITATSVEEGLIALRGRGLAPAESLETEGILDDPRQWRKFGDQVLAFDEFEPVSAAQGNDKSVSFLSFAWRLMQNDGEVRKLLKCTYPEVDLFVGLTMQLGPTYGQAADGRGFLDYAGEQLRRVRALDESATGNQQAFVHFVAFNPFVIPEDQREEPATGWEDSLAIQQVVKAIAAGAWGVKYYPPQGYRPSHNEITELETNDPVLRQQWESRYNGFTNEELDGLNRALFAYCARNGIPVLAHSQHGEFEALKCYGAMMANPSFYRPILEEFPDLRLCFGHAGGSPYWFREGSPGDEERRWGEQVFELCATYPNVYCEVGIFGEISVPASRDYFARHVGALVRAQKPHGFGQKIIYGTDWTMPNAISVEKRFLADFRDVFRTQALYPHYEDFFARNALRFLDLLPANPRFQKLPVGIQTTLAELTEEAFQESGQGSGRGY